MREHRFFSALEEVDIASIGELVRTAYEGGKKSVSVKFSDGALCAQAKDYFLTDYHIQDYCPKLSSVYYHTNEQLNIFTILFP